MRNKISDKLANYMKDYLGAESNDVESLFRFKDEYLKAEADFVKKVSKNDKQFYRVINDLQKLHSLGELFELAFDAMKVIETNTTEYKMSIFKEIEMIYCLCAIDDFQRKHELVLYPDKKCKSKKDTEREM